MKSPRRPEPYEVLFRIQRGLSGYISYLAACDVNTAFSEYVLYEPILRILMAQGYAVRCEYPCPGIVQPTRGDKKKVDFEATKPGYRFALEIKWAKHKRIEVSNDCKKLAAFKAADPNSHSFFCLFGKLSDIGEFSFPDNVYAEPGYYVQADFGRTTYGCRIFELRGAASIPTFSRSIRRK